MTPYAPDLAADLDLLLEEIRVEWEFTNTLTGAEMLKGRRDMQSHVFARAIIEAEGMKPDREPSWMRRIKRRFVQRYRKDSISNDLYREYHP